MSNFDRPSYSQLFNETYLCGAEVKSRLGPSRELIGAQCWVHGGQLPRKTGLRREIGYMELLQLISGRFYRAGIQRVAPKVDLSLFTDIAAYGPRTIADGDQLYRAIKELRDNPGSRRAVIQLASRFETPDQRPCTNTIQFLHRGDRVDCVVSMRSWDLWLGAPYDLMMFNGLQQVVASCVSEENGELRTGDLCVMAGSAHVYAPHYVHYPIDPSALWSFNMPLFPDLGDYRRWAESWVYNIGWRSGPPYGVRERGLGFVRPINPPAEPISVLPSD